MSKKLKLMQPDPTTDWSLCILCQEASDQVLLDPLKTKRSSNEFVGYRTLSENLQILNGLDALPFGLGMARLDDGTGIQTTLISNNAKWHKNCYMSCNKQHIERIQKRNAKHETSLSKAPTPVKDKLRGCTSTNTGNTSNDIATAICFFCNQTIQQSHKYHCVETMNVDRNVRLMATEMNDTKLLAKLMSGDMPAKDAAYHKVCMTNIYTEYRSFKRHQDSFHKSQDMAPESIALAELVSYVEDVHQSDETQTTFKLHDLVILYTERLKQLTIGSAPGYIHATRIKDKLLNKIPNLEAYKSKTNDVVLSFKEDIGDALMAASQTDHDSDAVTLMRAAQIIRNQMFQAKHSFNGSLLDDGYDSLAPSSLVALVKMTLYGANIQNQTTINTEVKSTVSSLVQLITFNAVKRSRKDTQFVRHSLDRETQLPLYLGLLIHNKTRKRDLIDVMFEKGISVSYDRVLQVSTDEANKVIAQYERDEVVCPTILKGRLYTTGNLDNIDHNPTSSSAQDSFHGTALSLTQHVTSGNHGIAREYTMPNNQVQNTSCKAKTIKALPDTYTYVPPAQFPIDKPTPVIHTEQTTRSDHNAICVDECQNQWLCNVHELLQKATLDPNDNISWSAYFASQQHSVPRPPAITGMMPMFRDSAHTLAMVKHGMNLIQKATAHVNPEQVPVITLDQPLYALAKKIQWSWPVRYGEDKYVVLLGGLHIEMAMLSLMGDWLEGSGWTTVLDKANVTTEGRAEHLLKGSDISRAQWSHQVTTAALFALQKQAYMVAEESTDPNEMLPFPEWCDQMEEKHPQFCYWNKTLKLELLFLQLLRSQREGNFTLYVDTLRRIIPWMFALDHYHYSRWLTIHVRDLLQLEEQCPSAFSEFSNGHFVTQKTCHKFSAMAHDHIHEQLNAVVKGVGGAIGITENEGALRRWMVAGPEISRIIHEYEDAHRWTSTTMRHHEQIYSTQKAFASDVKNVIQVISDMGNPFAEDSTDLFSLDKKVIMSEEVVLSIRTLEDLGKAQYHTFVEERLTNNRTPFNDTIRKNNYPLLKSGKTKISKSKSKLASLQSDLQLFSRMYISCQSREGDMDTFFQHENHAWPPSLAENNAIHQSNKSDLLACLECLAPRPADTPVVEMKVIDGAGLVHVLEPKRSTVLIKTFSDYAQHAFMPYLHRELNTTQRVDVVFDVYRNDSLKSHVRQNRGEGVALRVAGNTVMPANWKSFLRVDSNKTALFSFLANVIKSANVPEGKILLSTECENIVSSTPSDVSTLQPCTHEEADYRMLLHVAHGYHQGFRHFLIQATDTDVLVLAVAAASAMTGCTLWLAFGHGTKFRYISAHAIAAHLGTDWSWGLLFLHAVSGCDTVSFLHGIGKKTAWDVWRSLPQLAPLFKKLSHAPSVVSQNDMDQLERCDHNRYAMEYTLSLSKLKRKSPALNSECEIVNENPMDDENEDIVMSETDSDSVQMDSDDT